MTSMHSIKIVNIHDFGKCILNKQIFSTIPSDKHKSLIYIHRSYRIHVTRKQTLRSLSLSYQKTAGHAHPPFGMTPTFRSLTLLTSQIIFSKSRCHTKRMMDTATHAHPSFAITMTKVCFLVTHVTYHFIFIPVCSCLLLLTENVS